MEIKTDTTKEYEWLLKSIVDSSDDAIISQSLDGVINSWNRGAETLYGYSEEQAKGKPIFMLLPVEQHDILPGILMRIRQGEVIKHYETKRLTKDGDILDVSLTISPIKTAEGDIIGTSFIARDITERTRLEEEKSNLVIELQDALAKVKQLSGFIPICASCKKIRDDEGYWSQVETYISKHSEALFSHGICPDCMRKLYPDFADEILERQKS
jgi:PAS domain S-box-containing protein